MAGNSEDGNGGSDPNGERADTVGYRRPPRHSRFKPGRSGNPKGRPKGAVGCKTILERVVLAQHRVTEQGKRRRRTTLELILLALRARSMEGDHKAFAAFHDLLVRYGPRDTKLEGGFIFMLEPLSPGKQDVESKRVRDLEQERNEAWQPLKRGR